RLPRPHLHGPSGLRGRGDGRPVAGRDPRRSRGEGRAADRLAGRGGGLMTTWMTREVVSRRREWIVPAAQPWGAAVAELYKALQAADRAYRDDHDLPTNEPTPDDALRVTV